MSQVSKILDDSTILAAASWLEELGTNGALANKLKALLAVKEHGITEVAKIFCVTRGTLTSWIKLVKNGSSPDDLMSKPKAPRKSLLAAAERMVVKGWLQENGNLIIEAVRLKILQTWGIAISKSSVHRLIQQLDFAYITPRPQHHKQDQKTHAAF